MAFRGDLFLGGYVDYLRSRVRFLLTDSRRHVLWKAYRRWAKNWILFGCRQLRRRPGNDPITRGRGLQCAAHGRIMIYIPYLAFIIPHSPGLRLAKFNIDDRQKTSFLGLPVPANALFWASACYSTVSSIIHFNEPLYIIVSLVLAFVFC